MYNACMIVLCSIARCIIFGVPRLPVRPCDERPPAMYGHFCLVLRVSVHVRLGTTVHHLMYADDLVIMAPSVAGLSKLLKICESFGASHDMIFNQKKSASVYFISKTLKGAHLPNVYLNGEVILQVDSVKYLGHYITN